MAHRKLKWDQAKYEEQQRKKKLLPENSIFGQEGDPLVRRDMMFLAIALWSPLEALIHKDGGLIDSATVDAIFRGYQVMVKNMPTVEKMTTTKKVMDDVAVCLKASNSDNAREAALAVSYMIVKLMDEKVIPDPTNSVVLSALRIIEEAREDGKTEGWRFYPDVVAKAADKIRARAELANYLIRNPLVQ